MWFLRLDNLDTIVENLEYIEGQYEGSLLSRKYYYKKTLDYSSLLYYGEIDSKGRPDGIGVIVELQDGYYYGDEPCLSIQYAGCFKNGMYDGYGLSFDVKKMEDIPYSVSYETLINNYFLFNGMVTHEGYFKEGRYDGKGVDYVSGLYALLAGVEDESYEVNPLELEYSIDVGKYKDGKPKGNVKRYFRDVLYYDGEMDREGNYHGKGKLYDDVTGKLIYDGEFSRGEYHGKGTLYDENGKVIHKGKFKFGDIK